LNASKQGCQDSREEVLFIEIVTPEPFLNSNPVPLCVGQDVQKHIDEALNHLYNQFDDFILRSRALVYSDDEGQEFDCLKYAVAYQKPLHVVIGVIWSEERASCLTLKFLS